MAELVAPYRWAAWRDGFTEDGTPCRYRFGLKQTVEDLRPLGSQAVSVSWTLWRQTTYELKDDTP